MLNEKRDASARISTHRVHREKSMFRSHSAMRICLSIGLLLSGAASSRAAGRWNLPSSVPQYFGYGHGPGYHAPRIRVRGYYPPHQPRYVVVHSSSGCNSFYPDRGQPGQDFGACSHGTEAVQPVPMMPAMPADSVVEPIPAAEPLPVPDPIGVITPTAATQSPTATIFSPPAQPLGMVRQIPSIELSPTSHDHQQQRPVWR